MEGTPSPYTYSITAHVWRHGPYGYKGYESYRVWLRDEFSFRCVFCLRREQWGLVEGMWDFEHFAQQHSHPQHKLAYDNLVYAYHTCNSAQRGQVVPGPCEIAFG